MKKVLFWLKYKKVFKKYPNCNFCIFGDKTHNTLCSNFTTNCGENYYFTKRF